MYQYNLIPSLSVLHAECWCEPGEVTGHISSFYRSSTPRLPVYAELGRCLASKKIKVVFGGSKFGLLGKLADSVLTNGGQITGIIPEFLTSMTFLSQNM